MLRTRVRGPREDLVGKRFKRLVVEEWVGDLGMYEPWIDDPVAFISYIGQPPSSSHTLDRIDNSKGYLPGNIRWATPLEQGSNKSNNRIVVFQGEKYTIAQLARKIAVECGITPKQFTRAFEKAIYNGGEKGE